MNEGCKMETTERNFFEAILENFYLELNKLEETSRGIEDGVVRLSDFREVENGQDCEKQHEPIGVVEKLNDCLLRFGRLNNNLTKCGCGLMKIV